MQGARRCLGGCAHGHDYVWFRLEYLLLLATVLTRGPCAFLELCTDGFFVYFGSTARLWEFSTFAFFFSRYHVRCCCVSLHLHLSSSFSPGYFFSM